MGSSKHAGLAFLIAPFVARDRRIDLESISKPRSKTSHFQSITKALSASASNATPTGGAGDQRNDVRGARSRSGKADC